MAFVAAEQVPVVRVEEWLDASRPTDSGDTVDDHVVGGDIEILGEELLGETDGNLGLGVGGGRK